MNLGSHVVLSTLVRGEESITGATFDWSSKTEIGNFDLKWCVKEVDFPQERLLLLFVHISKIILLREVKHDILELEVAMDDQHRHHIVEALDKHAHNLLYY